MRSFAQRSPETEMMDAVEVPPDVLAGCLGDLARVNTLTLARPPTLAWLSRATKSLARGAGFTLLDVGYGEGDMLRVIHRWAVKAKLTPHLAGIDLSPSSAPAARAATDPALNIEYLTGDVFEYAPAAPVDFVVSSLVTHHMTDDQVVQFIRWMEATTQRGWFINDLHRHPIAFYGFKIISTLAGWHPFVRHDGPVSVARAFQRADWERLLARAGVQRDQITLNWRFPFRLCVGHIK